MTVCYRDILQEGSRVLNSASSSEAAYRTVIGSSYYALYHAALAFADTHYVPPVSSTSGHTHSKLSGCFMGDYSHDPSKRLAMRKIGYNLKRLHGVRVKADYYIEETIPKSDAEATLSSCELNIKAVEDLAQEAAA